ncbi:MAG: hydrolase, partial [Idiomarina sp.]|nr:hydrolase [Idiomarina sp.]
MSPEELHLQIRNLRLDDYEQLKELMDAIYTDIGGAWSSFTIEKLIKDFAEGQFCLEDNGRIIGVALTVKVAYNKFSNPHTYDDLIGHREAILNDKKGDALYGLDVLIH